MARGNQRDKAREKNQKETAGQVRIPPPSPSPPPRAALTPLQKKKNNVRALATLYPAIAHTSQQTGTEFARTKEAQAAIMRAKQDAGTVVRG